MEKIIIILNIRNEPKLMCIVSDIVSNLVNGGKYTVCRRVVLED